MNPADEKRELEGIKYLKENNDMTNLEVVLKVYNKLVEQNVFKTKAGIGYLRELQSQLIAGDIPREKIRPIPIIDFDDEAPAEAENPVAVQKTVKPEVVAPRPQPARIREIKRQEPPKKKEEKTVTAPKSQTPTPVKTDKYKSMFVTSFIFNIILAIIIIVMMAIAGSSGNPTILNYEEKLQDKYAAWEQDLKERERDIKRQELNNP